jgi:hypothetical protein
MICSYANVELLRISYRTRNEDILPWHGNSYGLQKEFEVIDMFELVGGLMETLQKYYNKPLEKQAEHSGMTKFPAILE